VSTLCAAHAIASRSGLAPTMVRRGPLRDETTTSSCFPLPRGRPTANVASGGGLAQPASVASAAGRHAAARDRPPASAMISPNALSFPFLD
jgi:hypothetical protein